MSPADYHLGHDPAFHAMMRCRAAELPVQLRPLLKPGLCVIDLGSGPGNMTCSIADIVRPGRVLGIDASPAALATAVRGEAGRPNLEFVLADARKLPCADASFDLVHAHTLLMHVPDTNVVLREAHRVLRFGGRLVTRDGLAWLQHSRLPRINERFTHVGELAEAVRLASGCHPDRGLELRGRLHSSGFEVEEIHCESVVYDQSESLQQLAAWSRALLLGPLGQRACALKLATARELQVAADALAGLPIDPTAMAVLSWLSFIALRTAPEQSGAFISR